MVLSLSIHTVTAWRQLRKFDRLGFRTPVLWCWKFPWGKEEYWGDRRVYLWFRGAFASTVIQSWLMALEDWAFAQIEAGANLDETIQSVISHNPCVAVLGIAVTLALESNRSPPQRSRFFRRNAYGFTMWSVMRRSTGRNSTPRRWD